MGAKYKVLIFVIPIKAKPISSGRGVATITAPIRANEKLNIFDSKIDSCLIFLAMEEIYPEILSRMYLKII